MTLTDIRRILAHERIRLTRSLGQTFLHDGNQLRKIIATANPRPGDPVLEIGPGLGPLTELLLAAGARVLAIEKEPRLVAVLRQRFADHPWLTLIQADALEHLRAQPSHWEGWRLVANLPYCVASPILVELAGGASPPDQIVVTVQWEVAQRLLAAPGGGDYGVLTLLVRAAYETRSWFKVPAACFFPAPSVDSACVCLARRAAPLVAAAQWDTYARVVKRAFSQRRKMMAKLRRMDWPAEALEGALARAGLARELRAEAISVEQFAQVAAALGEAGAGRV